MDSKIISPLQAAPVSRNTTDLLAELSEESLSDMGVAASISVECIRVCFCSFSGADAE